MGSILGWQQDGSGVRREWAGDKGSDSGERGILERGQQEMGEGVVMQIKERSRAVIGGREQRGVWVVT